MSAKCFYSSSSSFFFLPFGGYSLGQRGAYTSSGGAMLAKLKQ